MKFKRKLKKSLGFENLTQLLESVHFSRNSLISWRVGTHFEQKFLMKKLFRMKFPTFPYFQNFYMTKIEENRFSPFWARNILLYASDLQSKVLKTQTQNIFFSEIIFVDLIISNTFHNWNKLLKSIFTRQEINKILTTS